MFRGVDVGCHRCSVSLRLDGVSHVCGACFVGLSDVIAFRGVYIVFHMFVVHVRGVDVGCYPCSILLHLHSVSHVLRAYRRMQNPCETTGATSVQRGMRSFWITMIPKGPCTQIVDALAPKYPNRDYFKAKVYTI